MMKHKLFVILSLLITIAGWSQYSIENIPDPKKYGQQYFVSDPNNILGSESVDSLNRICIEIEAQSSAEVAIVVIDDFEGGSDFDFAYKLFNYWGIGKKENNNGLLVFIARDRRKYQFVTGLGMEGTLTDVAVGAIGERYLVPRFKEGDYGGGLIDAMNAIKNMLQNPEAIQNLQAGSSLREGSKNKNALLSLAIVIVVFLALFYWLSSYKKHQRSSTKKNYRTISYGCAMIFGLVFIGIFVISFSIINARKLFTIQALPWIALVVGYIFLLSNYFSHQYNINNTYKDEENIVLALKDFQKRYWPLILICPLLIFVYTAYLKRKKLLLLRLQPPDDSGKWIRLNKDKIRSMNKYLDKGQLKEEKIKSVSYEIWERQDDKSIKLVKWNGKKYNKYEDCPSCKNRTFGKMYTKTIKAATYSSTGVGEKMQDCEFCNYTQSFGTVILARLQKSSSGSGGSRSGSSGGGGSWGGGRSGGGGAGGSW